MKIGARIVRHGRYVVFQPAEVAVPGALLARILGRFQAPVPQLQGTKIGSKLPMDIHPNHRAFIYYLRITEY